MSSKTELNSSALMEDLRQKKRKQIADSNEKAKKAKAEAKRFQEERRVTGEELAMWNRNVADRNYSVARKQIIEFVHSLLMKQDLTKPVDIFITVGCGVNGYGLSYSEQVDEGNGRSHDDVTTKEIEYRDREDPDVKSYNIDAKTYFLPDCLAWLLEYMESLSLDAEAKVYPKTVKLSFYGPASTRIYIWCDMTAV